jgi:hypothetical protein
MELKEKPHMPSLENVSRAALSPDLKKLERLVNKALSPKVVELLNSERHDDHDQSVLTQKNDHRYPTRRSFEELKDHDQSPDKIEPQDEEEEVSHHSSPDRECDKDDIESIVNDSERCPCCTSCLSGLSYFLRDYCKNLGF